MMFKSRIFSSKFLVKPKPLLQKMLHSLDLSALQVSEVLGFSLTLSIFMLSLLFLDVTSSPN